MFKKLWMKEYHKSVIHAFAFLFRKSGERFQQIATFSKIIFESEKMKNFHNETCLKVFSLSEIINLKFPPKITYLNHCCLNKV